MKKILSLFIVLLMILTLTISASAETIKQEQESETMAFREIPQGSIEIQTGLWAHQVTVTILGEERLRYNLYSAEGYCFYDLTDEYYDNEGNQIPESEVQPNQRIYYQYMILPSSYDTLAKLNARFVSVPVQEGFEIVSVGNNHEIA